MLPSSLNSESRGYNRDLLCNVEFLQTQTLIESQPIQVI